MADQILVLDGNEDIVSVFKTRLLELGMIPIEMDIAANSREKAYSASDLEKNNLVSSFEDEAFFGKKDNSQFTLEPIAIVTLAVTLLGSAGFATIVTNILKAHKGEGSIEVDEKGNVTKVTFKDMNPKEVPKMIEEITEAVRASSALNRRAMLNDTSLHDNSFTEDMEN